jgi:hypothetical protein
MIWRIFISFLDAVSTHHVCTGRHGPKL